MITVYEGTYHERINPLRGGQSDSKRITYQAAKGEKVVIKGSEINVRQTLLYPEKTGINYLTVRDFTMEHVRRLFEGCEMAGIKIHAPIDTLIQNNHIHHAIRGIWLDWMTQGTRVSRNLFYDNILHDMYVEVNHGPFLVENNIFLSPTVIFERSQGGDYVHNFFAGKIDFLPELGRTTPYQVPHGTKVGGMSKTFGGDDRFYNNIFIGKGYGLAAYNKAVQVCQFDGNVYFGGAQPSNKDVNQIVITDATPQVKVVTKGNNIYLELNMPTGSDNTMRKMVTSKLLGKTKISNAPFENYDGKPFKLDIDYFGKQRNVANPFPGPFEQSGQGVLILKVW